MQRALFGLVLSVLAADAANVVVLGDSWGTYGAREFENMLTGNHANLTLENAAVSGSTAVQWTDRYMDRLISAVSPPDVKAVWLIAGGNDAQASLPLCAAAGKSRAECAEELTQLVDGAMHKLLSAIFDNCGNSSVRVVLFGYDIMSFSRDAGLLCAALPLAMFPSCVGQNECFNSEFIKIQETFGKVSVDYPQTTVLNLLGGLQAHAGYNASLGSPDLDRYSPAELYGDCIHPNSAGFDIIFGHMWNLFFSTIA
ncbi:hypothetical protein DIPPA_00302 [Diplonema papillatum]|nr:hypothetical protein DIPPA_00302 [Diplonema papillatum]|eukprot:gene12133-18753_t